MLFLRLFFKRKNDFPGADEEEVETGQRVLAVWEKDTKPTIASLKSATHAQLVAMGGGRISDER